MMMMMMMGCDDDNDDDVNLLQLMTIKYHDGEWVDHNYDKYEYDGLEYED